MGVGFGKLVEGEQTLKINLHAPSGYVIDESMPRSNDGEKLWNPASGRQEDGEYHEYEVTGLWPYHGHAVGFYGTLKPRVTGPGATEKPTFDAAVADLDLDMDVLHVHQDAHWTPTNSEYEDKWEFTEEPLGGFLFPAPLHGGFEFPATAAGTNYKVLRIRVRPKWVGPPNPTYVGTLWIFKPGGVAIYEPGGGARLPEMNQFILEPIDVPASGFTRDYGLLTNDFLTQNDSIRGEFAWNPELRGSSYDFKAQDDINLVPLNLNLTIHNGGYDLDNGEAVGPDGAAVDEDKEETEGAYLLVNWDDDDGDGQMTAAGTFTQLPVPDLTENSVANEDNLAKLVPRLQASPQMGTVELTVTSGATAVRFWSQKTKGTQIPTTKTWDLAVVAQRNDFATLCANGIWMEGVAASAAERDVVIQLKYTLNGKELASDTVKATVVMINLANAVYRDNELWTQGARGHAALVARFMGPSCTRECLMSDRCYTLIEMDGPTDYRLLSTITGDTQYGCFTNESVNYVDRLRILGVAKGMVARANDIGYDFRDALAPQDWDGRLDTIETLRCDGLVETCYEMNGVNVWAMHRALARGGDNTYNYDIASQAEVWTYNATTNRWTRNPNSLPDNLEEHNDWDNAFWADTLMPATQCGHVTPQDAATQFSTQNLCRPVGTTGGN
ncbi:MAG: hypothetical protein JW809_15495 [Pirellulales bacterium]|nr:hypothetical protein [Pirellulales bacterium]